MKKTPGELARGAMGGIPLGVWESLAPAKALALCYHVVSDSVLPHVRTLFRHKSGAQFSSDIEYLKQGHDIVGVGELAERLDRPEKEGRRPAAITFDDGMAECHTVVRPILGRLGARATFFVTTGCLDNRMMLYRHKAALCVERIRSAAPEERAALVAGAGRDLGAAPADAEELARFVLRLRADRLSILDDLCGRMGVDTGVYLAGRTPYLTLAQVRDLASDGHVIGAHGITHRDFQLLGEREIEEEIVSSCGSVGAITGKTPVPFAAPFTLEDLDRGMLLRIQKRNPGVGMIFGTSGLKAEPRGLFNRLVVDSPRYAVEGRSNLPRLLREAHAARAYDALGRFAGRIRALRNRHGAASIVNPRNRDRSRRP